MSEDPGGSGAETTKRLCFVCNIDPVATNALQLWEAAISRKPYSEGDEYLRGHYWTNATMHGFRKKKDSPERKMEKSARLKCSAVLDKQLRILSPKVIIACGQVAADSLRKVGLLKKGWDEFKGGFANGAYMENRSLSGVETSVFCTYHTGDKAVNIHAPKLYTPHTDELLNKRMAELEDGKAIQTFLANNPKDSASGRGMRVLVLHWLDIGDAIRRAHDQHNLSVSPDRA